MTPLLWFLLGALVALPLARLWARVDLDRAREHAAVPQVRGPQAPNIRGKHDDHRRFCTQPQHGVGDWGRVGDVRRCEHGRIMLGVERLGTVPPVWRDLDPLFDWRRYQRAQAALAVDPGPQHPAPFEPRPAPQPPQSDTRKGSRRKR